MAPWRLSLLGGFKLERPGETITRLRTQKTVALLAWLALNPHREHGREELIERFWPESDLEQGRASLRVALNALKKALEPPPTPSDSVLIATRTHLKIRPEALTTDVAAFEAALKRKDFTEAQRLYTGPFLPGYYDEWIINEQERLKALLPPAPSSREQQEEGEKEETILPPPRIGRRAGEEGTNLPLTLTRFFGREGERERLTTLLTDPTLRVVTLTGPGGTGKTRLSIETGRQLQERFSGGVWFVALAETQDAQRIVEGLRDVLELPRTAPALAAIRDALGARPALVILDNLEQLADDAALALPPLLAQLPGARFLLTSRTRLGLPGEHVFPIAALPLPQPTEPLERLATNAALALFCDRARAALPEFGLTQRNAETLATLCRQLEGVPLALELAASWAGQLTPKQMQERFTAALALEGRRVDREARHLSVRAALRWSLELLPGELAQLFAQLSVFRGGFTAEAASRVCTVPATSFTLSRLREHSLLTIDASGEVSRFAMLESVREFAAESLENDRPSACERHAEWMLSFESSGVAQTLIERENVEAALAFLEEHDPVRALQLAAQTVRRWQQAGLLEAGIVMVERVLAHFPDDPPSTDLGLTLAGLAALYFYQGNLAQAGQCFKRRLKVAVALDDKQAIAEAQRNLGTLAVASGDYEAARVALHAALENLPQPVNPLVAILLHTNLGVTHYALGELDAAHQHFAAGITAGQDTPEARWLVNCWHGLGAVEYERGDAEQTEHFHRQGLALARLAGEPLLLGDSLSLVATCRLVADDLPEAAALFQEAAEHMIHCHSSDLDRRLGDESARLAIALQQPTIAAQLLGFADQLITDHQIHLFGTTQRDRERLKQTLQSILGERNLLHELQTGRQLSRDAFFRLLTQIYQAEV